MDLGPEWHHFLQPGPSGCLQPAASSSQQQPRVSSQSVLPVQFLVTTTAPARERRHLRPTSYRKVHFLMTKTAPARERRHLWPTFIKKVRLLVTTTTPKVLRPSSSQIQHSPNQTNLKKSHHRISRYFNPRHVG